jgi:LuxR family maltose regulon positive regulatory protein
MASQLVDTKLFIPSVRRSLVARSRLSQSLTRGAQAKLTLISAPAGFGKTTALAAWLAQADQQRSVAWLSLEESDRQPTSFWTYLVTALHRAAPSVGASVLPLLQAPQAPIETVLTTVLNELGALPHDLDLVLDDYHLADGPQIAAGMAFLLGHLPPQAHVVLSSRVDPDLPLARLRARGELVEVRAADLRFTPEEVSAYLNDTTGLKLTGRDIAVLEERTEGWIAALQLAALSMRDRQDVAAFIDGFAGDDRYIVDYLVEEVLARQPDDVRSFLVHTSILDRLTGPLCDAVTGQHGGGKAMLEALDRANLFVVPLDDNRRWYRYHHLFADVLKTHLPEEHPDQLAELHRRASHWYDAAGEASPAVRHALACGDVDHAAELVERAIPEMQRSRQEATIRGWLDDLPDEVVRVRPVLASSFVGALMAMGEFDDAPRRLRDVERCLTSGRADGAGTAQRSSGMLVADEAELARLPGVVELHWAGLSLVAGDSSGTHRHAQLAIARAAPHDHVTRAGASALSGLASWGAGDLQAAHRRYSACVDGLTRAGHIADVLGCSITLGDLLITQGRLGDALATYEHALALAARQPGVLRGTADMYVGISQIALERGDLPTAGAYLQRSRDLGEHLGLPQNPYRSRVAMARLKHAQGDLAGALDLLEDAQRVYTGDFSPNVRPIPALRARMLAAAGRVDEALRWAGEHHLSADDDLSYVREYEHITLARILLAQYRAQRSEPTVRDAFGLLERLLVAAERGERTGSIIEILVLQTLAHHARAEVTAAVSVLERAAGLGEPQGYVRVFAGEGPPMAALLRLLADQRPTWTYVRRLLAAAAPAVPAVAAFHVSAAQAAQASAPRSSPVPGSLVPHTLAEVLVEPLSERELQVLRLLATDLPGPDVARRLVVSLNTLRTHTRNIYAKLGVNSRRAAVRRAGDLNLL